MPDRPVVSIVVPCFNHGRYLHEALSSVGRPVVRTEIVVIDDGSTDSTAEVVATFETVNEFRWVRQANAGLAAARNRGLSESRGRYVVFLDADDRLVPGAVDIGAAKLDEHPECALVFGRCRMMDHYGSPLATREQPRIVRDHYRELLRHNYIWMPAVVMFRRDALERIGGFNRSVTAAADYEMYLHIARHHPVHDHGQVVADYRKHAANGSLNAGRRLRETLAVMSIQRPFLEGDEASLAAYEEGWRRWQEFYGSRLVEEIGAAVRDHKWLHAAMKVAVLAWYHPRGLWNHLVRRVELSWKRRARPSRPIPATEITGASSRASSSSGTRV